MKIRLHYNKDNAVTGKPWTLHTSKACHSASHVRISVPTETEEKPLRKNNPRYFITCNGRIDWEGDVAIIGYDYMWLGRRKKPSNRQDYVR